ncbi:MAG: hypothetical protein IKZ58_01050 [Selenomonadaceae bacterium]|nr:hypothetical protein [Selenomonadaceae bacterium]
MLDWEDSEIEKIDEKLKSQGLFEEGLDTNQKYYAQVKKIKKRRWKEIREKYRDLPPDTEINFGAIVDRQKE